MNIEFEVKSAVRDYADLKTIYRVICKFCSFSYESLERAYKKIGFSRPDKFYGVLLGEIKK